MKMYHFILFVTFLALMQIYLFVVQGYMYISKFVFEVCLNRSFKLVQVKKNILFYKNILTEINSRSLHPPNKPHPVVVSTLNFHFI